MLTLLSAIWLLYSSTYYCGAIPSFPNRIPKRSQAKGVIPMVEHTPVLAGVCGTDPFRSMPHFLAELCSLGFIGAELSHGRSRRRCFLAEPGRHGSGLRPGGRNDPHGARNGYDHVSVRIHPGVS